MKAAALLACSAWYLLLAWPSLQKPLISDEAATFALDAAQPHYGLLSIWHPPLCFDLLRGLFHLGHLHDQGLRLLGVIGVLLSLLLIQTLCRRIAQEERAHEPTLWAWVFFATNPLLIQGSTLLDIDTTILTPLMLLWLAVFSAGSSGGASVAWLLRCAAVLWLNLWAKLSTPFALPLAAAAWYGLQRRWREALRVAGLISLLAAGAFVVAWGIYAKAIGQPFASVFGRTADVLAIASHFPGVWLPPAGELVNRVVRLGLWLGPFTCALFGVGLWSRMTAWRSGQRLGTLDLCWLLSLPILIAYLVLGHHGGFPKYHVPLVALLAVCLAGDVGRAARASPLRLGLVVGIGAAVMAWVGLDPLYLWNYQLRLAVILTPQEVGPLLWRLGGFLALHGLVFAAALGLQRPSPAASGTPFGDPAIRRGARLGRRQPLAPPLCMVVADRETVQRFCGATSSASRSDQVKGAGLAQRILPAAVIGMLVWNFSMAWIQWRAPYSMTFLYGRDTAQMARLAQQLKHLAIARPGSDIVAPEDVLYLAGLPFSRHRATGLWHREGFLRVLTDPNVSTVVTSPEWYSIAFYRRVLPDPDVARLLQERFRPTPFGLETIWMRRGAGP